MELIILALAVYLLWRWMNRGTASFGARGALVGPVGWSDAGTDVRLVGALGRADGRRLLRHPAFVAGTMVTPFMVLLATETESTWGDVSGGLALGLVPLGWLTIVATDLVALRPRRTGVDELFASLPAPQSSRTAGLLAASVGPVVVAAAVAVGAVVVIAAARGDELVGTPQWDEAAAGILIVAGSACVGNAVARWIPNAGFGVLAVVATVLLQARFLDVTTWPWDRTAGDPMRFLAFIAPPAPGVDDVLEVRPAGWHLVYLSALVLVVAAVALARDGLRRGVVGSLAAGALVATGAGWVQTRPLSEARQAQMISYLADPAANQVCETSAEAEVCAYRGFATEIPVWSDRVSAVIAVLPHSAIDGRERVVVTQRAPIVVGTSDCTPDWFEDGLPPSVAARLTPEVVWRADGHVHPGFDDESFPCSERSTGGLFLSVQVAAWTVGLPPAPHGRDMRCTATGQARAAVALWAGAAASAGRLLGEVVADGASGSTISFAGWDAPPMWGVRYAVADAQLALAMLELPISEVRAVLEADWDRWVDPTTRNGTLAGALGIKMGWTVPPPGADPCP